MPSEPRHRGKPRRRGVSTAPMPRPVGGRPSARGSDPWATSTPATWSSSGCSPPTRPGSGGGGAASRRLPVGWRQTPIAAAAEGRPVTTTDRVPAAGPAADGEARAAPRAGGPGSETRRVPGDLEAGTAGGGSRRGRPPRLRVVVVAAVLAGAFAFLLAKGLGSSLDFYLPADQAVAQRAQLG